MNSPIIDTLTNELGYIAWKLCGIIGIAAIAGHIWKLIEKKVLALAAKKAYERKQQKLKKANPKKEPKWYPTGWVFNEETQKWDPPDYLSAEAEEKWAWDENKRIWVDKAKAARLERYYEFRKSQGKEPTYEEWKAARENEKR